MLKPRAIGDSKRISRVVCSTKTFCPFQWTVSYNSHYGFCSQKYFFAITSHFQRVLLRYLLDTSPDTSPRFVDVDHWFTFHSFPQDQMNAKQITFRVISAVLLHTGREVLIKSQQDLNILWMNRMATMVELTFPCMMSRTVRAALPVPSELARLAALIPPPRTEPVTDPCFSSVVAISWIFKWCEMSSLVATPSSQRSELLVFL